MKYISLSTSCKPLKNLTFAPSPIFKINQANTLSTSLTVLIICLNLPLQLLLLITMKPHYANIDTFHIRWRDKLSTHICQLMADTKESIWKPRDWHVVGPLCDSITDGETESRDVRLRLVYTNTEPQVINCVFPIYKWHYL